jgi:hypothetical protein
MEGRMCKRKQLTQNIRHTHCASSIQLFQLKKHSFGKQDVHEKTANTKYQTHTLCIFHSVISVKEMQLSEHGCAP